MAEVQDVKKQVMVAIINQGGGPLQVSTGTVLPGQSIEVPEAEAKKLCNYKHIVLASSVVKSVAGVDALKKENAELKAQVATLQAQVKEFLSAATKKDLEALKEKHGPASEEK